MSASWPIISLPSVSSSVYSSNVLQRCLRDVHVTTQHIMVAPKLDETLGKLMMGQDADTSTL